MWEPIIISIKTAFVATIIVLIIGVICALISVNKEFKGKVAFETIMTMPLVIPPSITGYVLLVLLGKNGPIGKAIFELTGHRIIFTWGAAVIAAVVVSLPLID
jgi:molybdate transport system permease protein